MTATLGAYIARRKNALLYLDIRDIFTDVVPDLFPNISGFLFIFFHRGSVDNQKSNSCESCLKRF